MHKINRLTIVKLASDYCYTHRTIFFLFSLSLYKQEKELTVR